MTEEVAIHEVNSNIVQAVGILVFEGGKVLTVRNIAGTGPGEGVTGLPAGKVRDYAGESEVEAAIREAKEEAGIIIKPEDLVEFEGNYFEREMFVHGEMKKVGWRVFLAKAYSGEIRTDSNNLEVTPAWVDVDRLHFYETAPNVPEVIHNARKFIDSAK